MRLALDVARDRGVQRLYFVRCCESTQLLLKQHDSLEFYAQHTHTEARDEHTPTGQRSSQQHGNNSMRSASADNNQYKHNDQFRDTGGPEADQTGHTAPHSNVPRLTFPLH